MRILIGYDGSDCARSAIQDLSVAGLGDDVEARVVSVADVFPHLTSEFFADENDLARDRSQLVREAKALARQALAEAATMAAEGAALVKEKFSRWQVEQHAIGDSPYWALVKEARRWKSDLVIVGSHGRSALTRALLGSVSQLTLSHAPCSVRVGRGRSERTGPLRLLVAHDFSSDAKNVIDHIKRRRWRADTIVTLVTILDPQLRTALPALFGEADHANGEALVLAQLEQIAVELSDVELRATPLVLHGNPRRLLPREAERLNADCIYLGAKGIGRIREILVGSVATSVANAASCSVEIVR
jgi:nucleotide-binding universal stress UspA family protein